MNLAPAIEQLQKELASLANGFRRTKHSKCEKLMPFKESIAEFRKRGASFNTIAVILRKQSIDVSHDTVWRFYRAFIEPKPKCRRRSTTRKSIMSRNGLRTKANHLDKPTPIASGYQESGPRIARIEDV